MTFKVSKHLLSMSRFLVSKLNWSIFSYKSAQNILVHLVTNYQFILDINTTIW